jgi:hypothetical protein
MSCPEMPVKKTATTWGVITQKDAVLIHFVGEA